MLKCCSTNYTSRRCRALLVRFKTTTIWDQDPVTLKTKIVQHHTQRVGEETTLYQKKKPKPEPKELVAEDVEEVLM